MVRLGVFSETTIYFRTEITFLFPIVGLVPVAHPAIGHDALANQSGVNIGTHSFDGTNRIRSLNTGQLDGLAALGRVLIVDLFI